MQAPLSWAHCWQPHEICLPTLEQISQMEKVGTLLKLAWPGQVTRLSSSVTFHSMSDLWLCRVLDLAAGIFIAYLLRTALVLGYVMTGDDDNPSGNTLLDEMTKCGQRWEQTCDDGTLLVALVGLCIPLVTCCGCLTPDVVCHLASFVGYVAECSSLEQTATITRACIRTGATNVTRCSPQPAACTATRVPYTVACLTLVMTVERLFLSETILLRHQKFSCAQHKSWVGGLCKFLQTWVSHGLYLHHSAVYQKKKSWSFVRKLHYGHLALKLSSLPL